MYSTVDISNIEHMCKYIDCDNSEVVINETK